MPAREIRIWGLPGIPEILPGTDLAKTILTALDASGFRQTPPEPAGLLVLVIAQKVVSKSEGCLVRLADIEPSARAQAWAATHHRDPRMVEVVLRQAQRIVRMERGIIIGETRHGYICANAGVDASNAPHGTVVLLPPDPDRSAELLRRELKACLSRDVAIIISDTFGRPWRTGLTNVALGVAGLSPLLDYRGQVDSYGRILHATMLAVADELAAAAELVMGKTSGIPVAAIAGFPFTPAAGSGKELIRGASDDLFR
jgi:coenzyme F420-0:L-glutamate ligase / coenzyme F420-1:gamma-L-glutamate ligase